MEGLVHRREGLVCSNDAVRPKSVLVLEVPPQITEARDLVDLWEIIFRAGRNTSWDVQFILHGINITTPLIIDPATAGTTA